MSAALPLEHRLGNGLRLLLCPTPGLRQAHVALFFAMGSRHEPADAGGITHMLEHMLFRGSRSHADATALNAAAEDLGGCLEGATYRDHLLFGTDCHPSRLAQAIAIVGELVTTPRYTALEVERGIVREEMLESLDADGRSVDIDTVSHALNFGSHGLGRPIEGTCASLRRFTRAGLDAYRRAHLTAANAVLCVAGPLRPQAVVGAAKRAFAALPAGTPRPAGPPPPPPAPTPRCAFVDDDGSQVDLRLSFRGLPPGHPGAVAQIMLARLLADGLASRLHAELVDRRGLAYALHAGPNIYADCSLFEFDIAVAPERAEAAVDALLEFAAAAGRLRYSDAELRRVRQRHAFQAGFMQDVPAELAAYHGRGALFGVAAQQRRLGAGLRRTDAAAARGAARLIFRPAGMALAAVGPLPRGSRQRLRQRLQAWR